MSDIDFDELDKAVTSALGTPKSTEDALDKQAPVLTAVPQSDSSVETTVVVEPPTSASAVATRQRLAPSPAARRGGRFMDMVHPSSDMANETKPQPTPKLRIVPSPSFAEETVKKDEAPSTFEQKEAPVTSQTTSKEAEISETTITPVEQPPVAVTESAAELPVEATENPSVTPASETPFLSDAKVEKRPLGGFSPAESDEQEDELAEQLPPEPVMPAALQSDIVAVESAAVSEEDSASVPEQKAVLSAPEQSAPTTGASTTPPATVVPSIPQQYTPAPSVTDETPHPVFDTGEYHQPLLPSQAPHKGSKTWVFVVIIAALLIVGAGLGYFAFMAGL